MNIERNFIGKWWWVVLLAGLLMTTVLVFLGPKIVAKMIPSTYESTAIVQINDPNSDLSTGDEVSDEEYLEAQGEIIVSDQILESVVEKLNLTQHWKKSEKDSLVTLREATTVQPRLGTNLIEIKVKAKDRDLAHQLAGAVALSYQNDRNAEEIERAEAQLKLLDAEIEAQQRRVAEKRKALDQLAKITGRPYSEVETKAPSAEINEDTVEGLRNTIEEAE